MKWADRKGERKKEERRKQPLGMNLDKERRSAMGMKSLSCLSLLYEEEKRKKENETSRNNSERFLVKAMKKMNAPN